MIQRFKKRQVEVETIQWNNLNRDEIEDFVGCELRVELESETAYVAGQGPPLFSLTINTKEGKMKAMVGDWIIKEPFPTGDRDFYPCKNEIFQKTYIEVWTLGSDKKPPFAITMTKPKIAVDGSAFRVFEVPITNELKHDCYSYTPLDAASAVKQLMLEQFEMAFDKYIMEHAPDDIRADVAIRLAKVGIKYKE